MSQPSNLPASVKTRLQNLARSRGEDFNLTLVRFGIERLLYRLSKSKYADKFLLKGAMLFELWDAMPHRPTRDLDLLGFLPCEVDGLKAVFKEIVQAAVEPDGLEFDAESITAEEIREDNSYGGIRVKLTARLGPARIPIQIDVGAGDAVTPEPLSTDFPTLLDFPAPHIRAYPIYTVVAEKIEAAVKLKETNSRMKDFYDLWFLFRRFEFEQQMLKEAIQATFARRKTALPVQPEPFTDELANDSAKQTQWAGFLRRNKLESTPMLFACIVREIRDRVSRILIDKIGGRD